MFTLNDLRFEGGRYYFPNSNVGVNQAQAVKLLGICNYANVLTDAIPIDLFVNLIIDIKRLEDRIKFVEHFLSQQKNDTKSRK